MVCFLSFYLIRKINLLVFLIAKIIILYTKNQSVCLKTQKSYTTRPILFLKK